MHGLFWKTLQVYLLGGEFYRCLLGLVGLRYYSTLLVRYSGELFYPLLKVGLKKKKRKQGSDISIYYCSITFSLFHYVSFCFMYFCTLLLSVSIFISSQFCGLEVQDQHVGRCNFFSDLPPWGADRLLHASLCDFPLFLCIPSVSLRVPISFSCKDTAQIGLGPTLMYSFELNHLFQGPVSKYIPILRYQGVIASTHEFGGNTVQLILEQGQNWRDYLRGQQEMMVPWTRVIDVKVEQSASTSILKVAQGSLMY